MYDALFASELQKYNPLVADVDKNVKAQTDLLGALEQENRVRAALTGDYRVQRVSTIPKRV